ncbi:MAG TPA: hypothetical protein VLG28_03840 [Acidimicrobiia bacterium]|nr:hypothetical protein [Acidimicrobiia bacterium]
MTGRAPGDQLAALPADVPLAWHLGNPPGELGSFHEDAAVFAAAG